MIERAKALPASVPRLFLPLAALAWLAACATGGAGSNPPLPGSGPKSPGSSGASGDDGSDGELPGDDAGDVDAAPGDDASPADPGSTCNDALHGLKALFVLPPVTCTNSTDCSAGECCFVGASGSTCVMQ